MTDKDRLQALEVIDDFMSENGDEFVESDYQLTTDNV